MSTIAYAKLVAQRDRAHPGKSVTSDPAGIRTWIDSMAALVPSEVLAAHAALIGVMTTIQIDRSGQTETIITKAAALKVTFYALCVLSMFLYVVSKIVIGKWQRLDVVRMFIPPLAFVGWTMLQRTTAFDAAFPNVSSESRYAIALLGAIPLGALSAILARKADSAALGG